MLANGAELLWEGTSSLRPATFPVYASSVSFGDSITFLTNATLGTGGWLSLARY